MLVAVKYPVSSQQTVVRLDYFASTCYICKLTFI